MDQPPKKFRKLSDKITLRMALWLILVTLIATVASFFHTSSIVTALIEENLEKYISVRGDRESQSFYVAELAQTALVSRLAYKIKQAGPEAEARFDKTFTRFPDGAIRDRSELSNMEHASYFIPKFMQITPEVKRRSIAIYDFLEQECFLSLVNFADCWAADHEGSLASFDRKEKGYAHSLAADFRNMEQMWMKIVSPEANPNRLPQWTKTYQDPSTKLWLITLVTPFYVDNKFAGALGNDIYVGQLLDRIINFKLEGTTNFVISAQGHIVAHPAYQRQILEGNGLLRVTDVADRDDTLVKAYNLSQKTMPFDGSPLPAKLVYELDSNYLIAMTRLQGPDWYLATLYPRSNITNAAYSASRIILIFGCFGFVLELILLGRLISEKLGRPMNDLVTVVEQVGKGDLEAKIQSKTNDEFEILGNAFNEMTYNLNVSRAESQAAMQKAVQASKVKAEFVASMSHEMRTPLNGILGMTHFLSESNLSTEQKKYAEFITESGNHLLTIVNQVLDVAKIEEKRYQLIEDYFTVESIISEVKGVHYFAAKQKGIPLDIETMIPKDKKFYGDASRIKQSLSNLVSNAIKFSDIGMVSVSINEILQDGTLYLRFVVKDQGIGVSDEMQAKLFESFMQVETSMSRRFGGTGLGLYLVKSFVSLMGGHVGVKSTLGRGSEFWFEVPARSGPNEAAIPEQIPLPTITPENTKPILVVEDNFVNQVLTETLIKKLGYSCEIAADGKIASEMFEEGKYSLILMDCQMPIMDGYESTKVIRSKEISKNRIPILALTANTENKDRETCLESGMDDMLSKPVKVGVFKEKLEFWLAKALHESSHS